MTRDDRTVSVDVVKNGNASASPQSCCRKESCCARGFRFNYVGTMRERKEEVLKRSTMQPPHNFGLINAGWNNTRITGKFEVSGSWMLGVTLL